DILGPCTNNISLSLSRGKYSHPQCIRLLVRALFISSESQFVILLKCETGFRDINMLQISVKIYSCAYILFCIPLHIIGLICLVLIVFFQLYLIDIRRFRTIRPLFITGVSSSATEDIYRETSGKNTSYGPRSYSPKSCNMSIGRESLQST
ncbi:hypothetical protein L9F63_019513, partial [Diploptera punctata]